jgi:polygalacturonase/sugar lactone lactonase YvrE
MLSGEPVVSKYVAIIRLAVIADVYKPGYRNIEACKFPRIHRFFQDQHRQHRHKTQCRSIASFRKTIMTPFISRSRILFAVACTVVFLSGLAGMAQAPAVATGDARTVTEPVFPATCQTLLASFHDVNEDVPLSVETGNTSLDLVRLQSALNACQGTNQAVELSIDASGNNAFVTGPISIPAGVILLIDPGVTLYFSRNAQDYDTTPGTHTCGTVSGNSNTGSCKNLITIKNANGAGIMGYGKMNGRGGDVVLNSFVTSGDPIPTANPTWWDIANAIGTGTSQQNPRWIQMTNSSNVTMYKITLKNAPNFHIAISGGTGVTVWGIKIVTPYTSHNTDGIDPSNGTNFTIRNNSVSDGDDNVAVGATNASSPVSNFSIIHNRFFAGHGESIGSITNGGANNVLYDSNMMYGDADVDGSNSTAIRIKSADDRGGLVQNIQYSNSCFANHGTQIQFNTLYNTTAGTETPNFKNILLQNLRFLSGVTAPGTTAPVATGSVSIQGASNNGTVNPISVQFDNVTMDTAPTLASPNTQSDIFQAQITLGPGAVSTTLATPIIAANGLNGDVVTGSGSGTTSPPTCTFTFLTPEITGPTAQTQTITQGQFATAVVILSPAEARSTMPYPTGTVTLTDENNNTVATATLPGTGDTIFIPITNAPVGTHTYSAAYSGDSVYPAITSANFGSTYSVTVNSGSLTATGLGLTGVPASTSFGTPFTATATLTGAGTPTGSISFLVNGAVYATSPISGKAASNTFNLPFGSFVLTAVYNGDSLNSASSISSSVAVVAAATATAIGSSATTSTVGTPVTLTATVTSAGGTPTGNVSFSYTIPPSVTSVTLGSGILTNGTATFSAFLPLGADSVVATYVASGSFATSVSTNALTVTVGAAPPVPDATLPVAMPYTITTIAGGGVTPPAASKPCPSGGGTTGDSLGDGCLGTSVQITTSTGPTTIDLRVVSADPFGNVYFTDGTNNVIHKIAPNGVMTDFAGLGIVTPVCAPTGAVSCNPLAVKFTSKPRGVYADPLGNVFIASTGSNQVLEVKISDGLMHLIAGSGAAASPPASSDGPNALTATLDGPRAVATDGAGNVYIADTTNNRIREVVTSTGAITTVVGNGVAAAFADNLPGANIAATAATIATAQGVAVDTSNNIYVAESSGVDAVCVTCAPGPSPLYSLLTKLGYTNIKNGNIYAVAGGGAGRTPGLGNTVKLSPQRVAIDPDGNLYISEGGSGTAGVADAAIWFEDGRTGFIHPIAGIVGNLAANAGTTAGSACTGGTATDTLGDGCVGTQGSLGDFITGAGSAAGFGVGLDYQGNVYISDTLNLRIRKLSNNLNFGTGPVGTSITKNIQIHYLPGDTPLTAAISSAEFSLGAPTCTLAADTTTDCLYAATFTPAVAGPRSASLAITTNLGNPGSLGLTGSGTGAGATLDPANQVVFGQSISPNALAVDNAGNVYVADSISKSVLKYTKSATTNGTSAVGTVLQSFMNPTAIAADTLGDVFVADAATGLISEITATGNTKTLATIFGSPDGLAVDSLNNLYVSDSSAKTVTEIGSNLLAVRTIANTVLKGPAGLAVDGSGNVFVADPSAGTVYRYDAATLSRTTASTAATSPEAVAVDAAGNLLIADAGSNQILAVPANAANAPFSVASAIPGNALALDSAGNVYTASGTDQVLELQRTLGTATYNGVGAAPSTFSLLSTGNAAANLSLTDPDTTNFALSVATNATCTGTLSALAVAPGGACTFTSSFAPTSRLNYTNAAIFAGNAGNASLATPPTLEILQVGDNAPFAVSLAFGAFTPSPAFVGNTVTLTAAISSSFGTPPGTVTFAVDGTALAPIALAGGAASATVSGLAAGNHAVTATFNSGDPNFANATATPTTLNVQKNFVSVLLSVQNASPIYNATNSATVTLTGSAGTPTGTVQFSVDGVASGSPVTVSSAAATYTLPVLTAGPHTIAASYSGDSTFASATAAGVGIIVSQATPTVTWAAPASVTYGIALSATQLNATATVPGAFVYTPALGTVLGAATQPLSVTFTPTDTVDYAAVTKPQSLVVNQASQTIAFAAPTSPVVFGVSPITLVATGGASGNSVSFTVLSGPGTMSGGKLTVTGAGTIQIAANQAGNTNYAAAAQATQSVVVNKATPVVSLQSSLNPALLQTSVTLTATVSAAATGTVTFLDGTTPLGTGTIAGGAAALATSTLATGSHSITAVYIGDPNFVTLSSTALTETVDDFSLSIPSGNVNSQTVVPGGTAVFTLTMSPAGGTTFPAAVTLSLGGLPAGATYTFSPASLPAGSGTTSVTLTIQIPQSTAAVLPIHIRGSGQQTLVASGGNTERKVAPFALALLLLPFAGSVRRAGKKLRGAMSVLLLLVAIAATIGLNGCGASGSGFFAQSPQSYTLTVTGTSGTLSRSTNITLTVE